MRSTIQTDIGREAALSPTLDASNDRLLTVDELAHVLKAHPVSVRRWAKRSPLGAGRNDPELENREIRSVQIVGRFDSDGEPWRW